MIDGVLGQRRLILVTATLVLAGGVVFALVRFYGEAAPLRTFETVVVAIAFGAVIGAPGLLALLALDDRPALLLPAAIVLVPLSFLSFALVTLPLLVPAVLFVRACARATPASATRQTAATTVSVVLLLVAALLALFAHDDPRHYMTATTSGGTSDVVSYAEAAVSLTCTTLAVLAGRWSAPRVRTERS